MQEIKLPATVEECHSVIHQFVSVTRHQQTQIEALTSKIVSLEARLSHNSSNSSRPPSSNFGKNTPKQIIKPGLPKEKKQQGGQANHKGNTLLKIENPDEIIQLSTPFCDCGLVLEISTAKIVQTYQSFDLPDPKLYVTEYQRLFQECTCGKTHLGVLPAHIHANVQYGPNVRAFTALLSNACQLSHQKVSTLFCDLFGYDLNESTVLTNNECIYESLAPIEAGIKTSLLESEVVHFDETGVKINKKLHWLHTACNTVFTYLFVHEKRGKKAHTATTSILPSFQNWAIHDCFASYFTYADVKHGLCNTHLLRELQFQIEQGKLWAIQIHQCLLDLYKRTQNGTIPIQNIEIEKQNWKKICSEAIVVEEILLATQTPIPVLSLFDTLATSKKRGRKPRGKALKLLDRLLLHSDAVLAFAQFEVVPFSNNQAERDIRPIKTKLKISGCFRTSDGANRYARIQGFISTCRKNKLNVFKELKALAQNPKHYKVAFAC